MKVILIARVAKLGSIGNIVNVKDGFARNFLIPQKKAIFYSEANYKIFESKKQHFEAENQKHTSVAEANQEKLVGKDVVIIENASDDGRLYGSVSTATIADKINALIGTKEAVVSRVNIFLSKPIKEIGVYDVKVDLYSGIIANVRVIVTRSESEIASLIESNGKLKKAKEAKEEVKEVVVATEEVAAA